MIGQSHAFVKFTQLIEKIARCDTSVLIEGEIGTGKELAACAIHEGSARNNQSFVQVNCGTISDTLIENELFEHERNGIVHPQSNQFGFIAYARRGTLFLDEIDALSPKAQITLLRFFQNQQFAPFADSGVRCANVRVIAASNRNLVRLAEKGEFRLDLLFRLKIMYLALPPLRERRGDVALLATHFLHTCAERFGCGEKVLHPETLAWFEKYSWPGNIRELENLIYREYLLTDEMTIFIAPPAHALERRCGLDRRRPNFDCSNFSEAKSVAIANFEQFYLAEALTKAHGNVTKAASLVGKDRRAFGKLLKKHNMDKNLYYLNGGAHAC